ncbi:immunity protein BlpZ [Streptococcus pneumoniae]|uniref:immunity protein BlpZ n=3 Tax=Streptococcus pneumoniae TaxID=1313 RepID=UPI000B6FDAAA|nr:immunity protein BlpZ [Streptococcus pneumoniae]SNG52810.1 immunity protein BlpZ [Streptococcus pneumoniae]
MYKHLFFLDSKTLDRLTPYILVLASDTIAFNVFVLTFVSAVVFNFLNSMLALMAIFIGAGYVVGFWLPILPNCAILMTQYPFFILKITLNENPRAN